MENYIQYTAETIIQTGTKYSTCVRSAVFGRSRSRNNKFVFIRFIIYPNIVYSYIKW